MSFLCPGNFVASKTKFLLVFLIFSGNLPAVETHVVGHVDDEVTSREGSPSLYDQIEYEREWRDPRYVRRPRAKVQSSKGTNISY